MADEIIRELWQIKDDVASRHNYDLKKLVNYLQGIERSGKRKVVDLRPQKKSAEPPALADSHGSGSLHSSNSQDCR